jgi:hypothetical protein
MIQVCVWSQDGPVDTSWSIWTQGHRPARMACSPGRVEVEGLEAGERDFEGAAPEAASLAPIVTGRTGGASGGDAMRPTEPG